VESRVHYGMNYNNAFQSPGSRYLSFGDGDGVRFSPLVSLDVVAHEFTHGVTEHTAGLIYANESGALNESFSDIFGTATEFAYGRNPNYLLGEACFTPGTPGDAMRSLADPPARGNPDYYPNRVFQGACTPDPERNDNCGVHSNSGIMNKAFYLLAEGGAHPISKVIVTRIGRDAAVRIFYRALTFYLTKSARFYDARVATLNAAADLYGVASAQYRSTLAAWNAVGVRSQQNFDFDADGRTDNAVWRPSEGTWYVAKSMGGNVTRQWGIPGDIIVPGDYDGDGDTDYAVWRPSDGTWYLNLGSKYNPVIGAEVPHLVTRQWGLFLDQPVPGDYDGDGRTDYAVWRPSDGYWHILNSSNGNSQALQWGLHGDVPVPGDYDGDGKTDRAVWRPSTGYWHVINSSDNSSLSFLWGTPGDVPTPGDYNGDGKTDLTVYRRSNGTWYFVNSTNGSGQSVQWGSYHDHPVPGDYDGDGKTDFAVWRPAEGNWYTLRSRPSGPEMILTQWGIPGDVPVPKANKYQNPLLGEN
jgi:Thermolysin metallopeptidase, alpha-helical domain/Thermolysin metallopeptidase, catalytic domain/FG-GAP-like repeat